MSLKDVTPIRMSLSPYLNILPALITDAKGLNSIFQEDKSQPPRKINKD